MLRKIAISLFAMIAVTGLAAIAQQFSNYPQVGSGSYCDSTVNGNCVSTIPAGPSALTGLETIPADTNAAQGVAPQTVKVPITYFTGVDNRNSIVGGDFATNLWQRGTSFASVSPSTASFTADRWAVYSSGNITTVNKQTGSTDVIPNAGLLASMRVVRPSGTNTTSICVSQLLDAKASAKFLGNNAVLSFYAQAGAGYLQTNDAITATIAYHTTTDSATGGANTLTFAAGTITGYTAVTAQSPFTLTSTIASGVATIPLTTSFARYAVTAAIPNLNASGTQVTGVGISICTGAYPASTGVAGDWFEIAGVQLETGSSLLVSPRGFERRLAGIEEAMQLYYAGGPGVEVNGAYYNAAGNCQTSGTLNLPLQLQIPLRTPPTSGGLNVLTAGGYSVKTAAATTAIGTIAVGTSTVNNVLLTSTAACTTTVPYTLIGTNTTGTIIFSADP